MAVRRCLSCKNLLVLEVDFYARSGEGYDNICKECRCQRARKNYTYKSSEKRKEGVRSEFMKRDTPYGFKHYMKNNPIYFERTFSLEPTTENIILMCNLLI